MTIITKGTYLIGIHGEAIALTYLQNLGFIIIAKRYKTSYGEIDIIVTNDKNKEILFVEVKTRKFLSNTLNSYDGLVSYSQQKRYYDTASYFLSINEKYINYFCRFDIIFVVKQTIIKHIISAW